MSFLNEVLFWLAAIDLALCVVVGLQLFHAGRRLKRLGDVEWSGVVKLPSISVIVAARNEERHIELALRSLLALDYPGLEIVVVDDRSTDRTGEILDRMANSLAAPGLSSTALRVVHLQDLPPGWIGKNHALYCGAREATGEWILFTDADIVMDPSVLRRAVAYLQHEELDHLAILFRIVMPSWLLEVFAVTFSLYFIAHFKPWRVRDPRSSAHIGVGGFNLLRAATYRQIGTHQAIAMRPDDDMKLGKLVKKHGFSQDVLLAPDLIYVPWYSSLRELLTGLEKNAFAGVDYNVLVVVVSSLAILVLHVFPFIAVFLTAGWTRALFGAVIVCLWSIAYFTARQGGLRVAAVWGLPLGVMLLAYIQWRTMLLNLWQGGIRWRDTFYPLTELRANRV